MSEDIGKIITFYSYKGGTGRSMALANVACLLARDYQKKVLMIDWDLEAPGLHRYFRGQFHRQFSDDLTIDSWLDEQKGLIDLFEELNQKIQDLDDSEDETEIQKLLEKFELDPFIIETDISNLYLLKAGRIDDNYSTKISEFSWSDFYDQSPDFFTIFAYILKQKYDYILIDSRTGATDTSGICTMLMPSILVAVFTPNRQSLYGVLRVAEKSTHYRQQSNDLRPLNVFPLPSRIETSESLLRETWRLGQENPFIRGYQSEFEKLFADIYRFPLSDISLQAYFDEVQIQHLSRYAYGEEIAVLNERAEDRLSLTRSYQSFTHRLVNLVVPWEDDQDKNLQIPSVTPISLPEDICPYRGLKPFQEEDAPLFFGRKTFIERLITRLNQEQCVAIVGASATGKSSIIQAGLIPQLKQHQGWHTCFMTPGDSPLTNLIQALANNNLTEDEIKNFSQEGAQGLKNRVQGIDAERVFLIVDRLEEIFTLCQSDSVREQFFSNLFEVLRLTPSLKLVVVIQSEFLTRCTEKDYGGLRQKMESNLFLVPQMEAEELREAIIKPVEITNLVFEPELVTQILEDMKGSSNSLPLLQYTLTQLWENRTRNVLSLKTYSQLGGIKGCLEKQATEVYDSFSDLEKLVSKHIFLSLTQLGEGTDVTRRRVLKKDLITPRFPEELVDKVLKRLAYKGLISLNSNLLESHQVNNTENSNLNETLTLNEVDITVEVVHEALIRQWSKLREWLDESRENLRKKRKIETLANEWAQRDRNEAYLLRGTVLQEAQAFQKEQRDKFPLSSIAEELIKKSNRSKQKTWFLRGGVSVLFLLALLLSRPLKLKWDEHTLRNCNTHNNCSEFVLIIPKLIQGGINLEGLDLRNATLSTADFSQGNLSNTDFSGTTLQSAIFFGANLTDATFPNANLSQANLQWALLIGAKFLNANLQGAILQSAIMTKANLEKADLTFTDLSRTVLQDAKFKQADLTNANLRRADLRRADFTGATLSNTNFQDANLQEAKFFNTKPLPQQIKSACDWQKAQYDPDSQTNLNYIKQLKQDKTTDPKVPPKCDIWSF